MTCPRSQDEEGGGDRAPAQLDFGRFGLAVTTCRRYSPGVPPGKQRQGRRRQVAAAGALRALVGPLPRPAEAPPRGATPQPSAAPTPAASEARGDRRGAWTGRRRARRGAWGSAMRKQSARTAALVLCILSYLLVGAAVFDALESEAESGRKRLLAQKLSELRRKYGFSAEDYRELERLALQAEPHRAGRQWKFAGSFYFAITVITTIGERPPAPPPRRLLHPQAPAASRGFSPTSASARRGDFGAVISARRASLASLCRMGSVVSTQARLGGDSRSPLPRGSGRGWEIDKVESEAQVAGVASLPGGHHVSCVTSDQLLNLSEPQVFSSVKEGC